MNKQKAISIFLIAIISVSYILPIETKAKTIKEFEAEVQKYTSELEAKKSKLAKNDQEVAEIKIKITNIENQITEAENKIESLQKEIDESNEKIKAKSDESKKIMEYYQISNGENAYLEYAFGATSITDMVYRMSVVEQLTEYNEKIMNELEQLIKENNQKQQDLTNKKSELNKLQQDLESEKERINADSSSIKETMPGLEEQIKSAKANVSYYKNLGCNNTEDIQACQYRIEQSKNQSGSGSSGGGGSVPSVNGWYRPMEFGYLTQGYKGTSHMGVDLSSSNKTIPIYPIAAGQVFAKYYDSAGALVIKIRHNTGTGYIYSTYAHLSSFGNVSEGQNISADTMIGRMGSTGNSTGPHLHLELTTCDWHKGGGCTWNQYIYSTINPSKYITIPSSWNNR